MPIQTQEFFDALKALKQALDSGNEVQGAASQFAETCSHIMDNLNEEIKDRLQQHFDIRWAGAEHADEGSEDLPSEVYAKLEELRHIVTEEQGNNAAGWETIEYKTINTCTATAEIVMCPSESITHESLIGALGTSDLDYS